MPHRVVWRLAPISSSAEFTRRERCRSASCLQMSHLHLRRSVVSPPSNTIRSLLTCRPRWQIARPVSSRCWRTLTTARPRCSTRCSGPTSHRPSTVGSRSASAHPCSRSTTTTRMTWPAAVARPRRRPRSARWPLWTRPATKSSLGCARRRRTSRSSRWCSWPSMRACSRRRVRSSGAARTSASRRSLRSQRRTERAPTTPPRDARRT